MKNADAAIVTTGYWLLTTDYYWLLTSIITSINTAANAVSYSVTNSPEDSQQVLNWGLTSYKQKSKRIPVGLIFSVKLYCEVKHLPSSQYQLFNPVLICFVSFPVFLYVEVD